MSLIDKELPCPRLIEAMIGIRGNSTDLIGESWTVKKMEQAYTSIYNFGCNFERQDLKQSNATPNKLRSIKMEPDKVAWLYYQLCHQDSDFLDHLTNLVIEFIPKHILDPCVPEEFKNPKERTSKERHKPMTEQVADKKRQEEHMLEVKKIVSELLEVSDPQEITRAGLEDFCKSIAEAAQLRISQSVKRSRSAMWNWMGPCERRRSGPSQSRRSNQAAHNRSINY